MLDRILSPLSLDDFASEYLGKRPVCVRGARTKFAEVLDTPRFERIVSHDSVRTRIRAMFGGEPLSIDRGDLESMYLAGATICATGIDEGDALLAQLARSAQLALNFAGQVSVRAYLSPPKAGTSLHFDARDATTFQIEGSKRWWYSDSPAVVRPTKNSRLTGGEPWHDFQEPPAAEMRSVLLRPGDLLYLPAGTWHRTVATQRSLSVNLAFDSLRAGFLDLVGEVLRQELFLSPSWRGGPPPVLQDTALGVPEPVRIFFRERLAELRTMLSRIDEDSPALADVWRELVAGKYAWRPRMAPYSPASQNLTQETRMRAVNPGALRIGAGLAPKNATILVYDGILGRRVELAARLLPLARTLRKGRVFRAGSALGRKTGHDPIPWKELSGVLRALQGLGIIEQLAPRSRRQQLRR